MKRYGDSGKLGCLLRTMRSSLQITQQQLASHLGISLKTVTNYETGKRNAPDVAVLMRFAALARSSGLHSHEAELMRIIQQRVSPAAIGIIKANA